MSEIVELTTTLETQDQAESIAKSIVESRLAACVQIAAIHSVYRWKNETCSGAEFRCSFKTTLQVLPKLKAALMTQHPYELPELVTSSLECSPEYQTWVESQVES
ncbi:MAG: divalent-cation tolerance protein CutA [Planctomycetota bacterium]